MVVLAPVAIVLGAVAAVGFALFGLWEAIHRNSERAFGRYATLFERANVQWGPQVHVAICLMATVVLWIAAILLFQPMPLVGLALLPVAAGIVGLSYLAHAQLRLHMRTEKFIEQLELALRIMGSGLRSGLGTRQSLAIVVDEMEDPARHEFSRVIGQANIGVSIHDALDDLAARIQRAETLMMSRVMRIQASAGGDLARVLEQLANTIRDRRRTRRKISSLTAEGRASTVVLVALPLVVGAFICLTQQQLGHALLFTRIGHLTMLIVLVLEVGGSVALNRIMQVRF